MSREIDRTKTLAEANEHELLIALGDFWAKKEFNHLTRAEEIEVRHVCLYNMARLEELRGEVIRPEHTSRHTILELTEVIVSLQSCIEYVNGKGGGTSGLTDRNKR